MKKHHQPSLRNRNRKVHHLNMDYLPLPGSGLTTTVDESRCRPQCQTSSGCTEICCETQSCISLQSESLSSQKSHTTFKGLIGSAPCGVVTFISRLYWGSISDIEMTKKAQILKLLQPGDGVIAEEGFLREKILSEVGATRIIPPLSKHTQLSIEDTQKTLVICRLRLSAERAICTVKGYHIWDKLVPFSLVGSVIQLWVSGTSWRDRWRTSLKPGDYTMKMDNTTDTLKQGQNIFIVTLWMASFFVSLKECQ